MSGGKSGKEGEGEAEGVAEGENGVQRHRSMKMQDTLH